MKNILLILAVFVSLTSMAQEKGVKFEKKTLSEVVAKNIGKEKLIFADCYTQWCGACLRMNKEVFTQKEMGDYFNKKFINLSIDMEEGEGVELRKRFGVTLFPTFVIMNAKGEELNRVVGTSRTAKEFIARVEEALKPENYRSVVKQNYEQKRDVETGIKYLKQELSFVQNPRKCSELLKEVYWVSRNTVGSVDKYILEQMVKQKIDPCDSIMNDMLNNSDRIIRSVGKEKFYNFILNSCVDYLSMVAFEKIEATHEQIMDVSAKIALMNGSKKPPYYQKLGDLAEYARVKDYRGLVGYFWKNVQMGNSLDFALYNAIRKLDEQSKAELLITIDKRSESIEKMYSNMCKKVDKAIGQLQ